MFTKYVFFKIISIKLINTDFDWSKVGVLMQLYQIKAATFRFQVCPVRTTRLADYGVAGFSKGLLDLLTEFPGRALEFCVHPLTEGYDGVSYQTWPLASQMRYTFSTTLISSVHVGGWFAISIATPRRPYMAA